MSLIHIARNNAVLGQFTEEEIRTGLASGAYLPTDLAWTTGRKDWLPLSQWTEFAATGSKPPPIFTTEEAPMPAMPSWERRSELGVPSAFLKSLGEILKSPDATFSNLSPAGGFGGPLLFLLIPSAISGILNAAVACAVLGSGAESATIPVWVKSLGMAGAAGYFLFSGLIMSLVTAFLYPAISQLFLMLYKGANAGYETTFRAFAYSSGAVAALCIPLNALMLVPVIGMAAIVLIFPIGIYAIVLNCIAVARAQKTDTWRAVMAVLTPILLCCCLYAVATVAMVGIFAGLKSAHP